MKLVKIIVRMNINKLNSFMTESLSYRNQSIDLLCKSIDWFLCDRDLCHEKVEVDCAIRFLIRYNLFYISCNSDCRPNCIVYHWRRSGILIHSKVFQDILENINGYGLQKICFQQRAVFITAHKMKFSIKDFFGKCD